MVTGGKADRSASTGESTRRAELPWPCGSRARRRYPVNMDNAPRVNMEHLRALRCRSFRAGSASVKGETVATPAGFTRRVRMAASVVMNARYPPAESPATTTRSPSNPRSRNQRSPLMPSSIASAIWWVGNIRYPTVSTAASAAFDRRITKDRCVLRPHVRKAPPCR